MGLTRMEENLIDQPSAPLPVALVEKVVQVDPQNLQLIPPRWWRSLILATSWRANIILGWLHDRSGDFQWEIQGKYLAESVVYAYLNVLSSL
jgi:hypothetical protein